MKKTEFGVNVTRKIDVGFRPYIHLLATEYRNRPVPFGIRENTTFEMSVWAKGVLEEGDELQEQAAVLIEDCRAVINDTLISAGIKQAPADHQSNDPNALADHEDVVVTEGKTEW